MQTLEIRRKLDVFSSTGAFKYWRKHDKVVKRYCLITYIWRGLIQNVKSRTSISKSLFKDH